MDGQSQTSLAERALTLLGVDIVRNGTAADWLHVWHDLAAITANIQEDAPRFQPVRVGLAECDCAFEAGNWLRFQNAALAVRIAINQLSG